MMMAPTFFIWKHKLSKKITENRAFNNCHIDHCYVLKYLQVLRNVKAGHDLYTACS